MGSYQKTIQAKGYYWILLNVYEIDFLKIQYLTHSNETEIKT